MHDRVALRLQPSLDRRHAMGKHRHQAGKEGQRQIQRADHQPEPNRGYDEAARGDRDVVHDRPDRMEPLSGDDTQLQNTTEDVDHRDPRNAPDEVHQRKRTSSRSSDSEP
jgi:hypothetical protein